MRLAKLIALAAAVAAMGVAAAHAEPSYTTANVNMRTGPDIDFPSVGVIPEGEPIYVEGCLRDESWCDVRWGPDRGWVYSEYLAFEDRGETVLLPDVGLAYFSIPIVTFEVRDYWGRYYVGRPWYRDRDRWYAYRWRPRVGWYAPPPGPRRRGWWRSRYVVPPGMRPPRSAGGAPFAMSAARSATNAERTATSAAKSGARIGTIAASIDATSGATGTEIPN